MALTLYDVKQLIKYSTAIESGYIGIDTSCTVCKMIADFGTHSLTVLLHEYVNIVSAQPLSNSM